VVSIHVQIVAPLRIMVREACLFEASISPPRPDNNGRPMRCLALPSPFLFDGGHGIAVATLFASRSGGRLIASIVTVGVVVVVVVTGV
jgi:hypothetical protein